MSLLRENYLYPSGGVSPSHVPTTRFLTSDGSILGSKDMGVNGAITPVDFYVKPEANETLLMSAITVLISDSGNTSYLDYGSVSGPLANGVQLFFGNDVVPFIPIEPPIVSNYEYSVRSRYYDIIQYSGSTRTVLFKDIFSAFSKSVILDGKLGERLGFRIQDDLSSLLVHEATLKGSSQISNFS